MRGEGLGFFESSVWAVLAAQFHKVPKLLLQHSEFNPMPFECSWALLYIYKSCVKEVSDVCSHQYMGQVS